MRVWGARTFRLQFWNNPGLGWVVFQQRVKAPNDEHSRWLLSKSAFGGDSTSCIADSR
jgi:hypothetical protein